VAEVGGDVGFADADRAEDEHAVACFGEPQGGQVGEQGTVVGEVVQLVPGLEPHRRVEAGGAGAEHRRAGLPAGDLVVEDELEERGVAELALSGQDQPLGQVWASGPSLRALRVRSRSVTIGSTGPVLELLVVVVVISGVLPQGRCHRRESA
jgi:hypothetical protein